jgi:hypothetical protein
MTQKLVCLSSTTTYEAGTHVWITANTFVIVVGITRTYKKCKPKHSESSIMERIARQGNILRNGERPIMLGMLSLGSLFGQDK